MDDVRLSKYKPNQDTRFRSRRRFDLPHQNKLTFTSGCISRQELVEEISVKYFVDIVGLFTVKPPRLGWRSLATVHTIKSGHDAGQISTAVGSLKRWLCKTSNKSHRSGNRYLFFVVDRTG